MRPRFEVAAAYALGLALPLLEVARRRTGFENLPAYVDDVIAGGLLLYAARSVSRRRRHGPAVLVAAWGILCGGAYYSFFGQLRTPGETDVSGLGHTTVLIIKGLLWAIAIVCLVRSVLAVARRDGDTS